MDVNILLFLISSSYFCAPTKQPKSNQFVMSEALFQSECTVNSWTKANNDVSKTKVSILAQPMKITFDLQSQLFDQFVDGWLIHDLVNLNNSVSIIRWTMYTYISLLFHTCHH